MIRIRFHGRGGQGMKTASRVVGTAALLDGFVAQDSPIYGAERRGAPMAAYTRISEEAILERGVIAVPDVVLVADDTLLDDPLVQPFAGLPPDGTLVIATAAPAEDVRRRTGHPGTIVARDFLSLALEHMGNASGVSAALAAVASALLGLSWEVTVKALREELAAIDLGSNTIEANLRLAEIARAGVARIELPLSAPRPAPLPLADVTYVPPEVGAPTITARPNTPLRRTGNWRVFRPVIELAKCTRCWICFVWCPEGAIGLDAEDRPHVDYDVCKGCLICVEECPTGAITKTRELRDWARAGAGR